MKSHTIPAHPGPRTAFVLAGGASLGALQAGMIRALYERQIIPDFLVGTSVGALNAAYLASRPATVETAKSLAGVWRDLHRADVFPVHVPTLIAGLSNQRDHLVPDSAIRRLARRHLDHVLLEDAGIPLHVIAFDVLGGVEIRVSEGPMLEAIMAAAAIPGVLPPVRSAGRLLIDGGVVNNTPISHAIELGAERIYVLPTVMPEDRALPAEPHGALDAAVHAFTLLANARLLSDLARFGREAELILLPAANPGGRGPQQTSLKRTD